MIERMGDDISIVIAMIFNMCGLGVLNFKSSSFYELGSKFVFICIDL
jgi:hypothetical protein